MEYGGFWVRFVAYLLDTVILSIVSFVVSLVLGLLLGIGGARLGTTAAVGMIMGYGIGLVLTWLYFSIMESSEAQATLGKRAMGLIVTDTDGYRLSFGRATGR